jgi:hypothetical protein
MNVKLMPEIVRKSGEGVLEHIAYWRLKGQPFLQIGGVESYHFLYFRIFKKRIQIHIGDFRHRFLRLNVVIPWLIPSHGVPSITCC